MNFRLFSSISFVALGLFLLPGQGLAQVKILSVAPAAAQPGATFVATGNSFPAGVSAANVTAHFAPATSGAGPTVDAPVSSLATLAGTTMRATVVIPPSLLVGAPTAYQVTFSASVAPSFTTATPGNLTINPPPSLSTALPASARLTQTLNIAITGNYSNFYQGISGLSFGSGITINAVTVTSPTSLMANVTVTGAAPLGAHDITVTTGSEIDTLSGGFTVLSAPTVFSATPASANMGTANLNVALAGSGTSWLNGIGVLSAAFGAGVTVNSIAATSDTAAVANISIDALAAAGLRSVTVVKGTETAVGLNVFTVTTIPATLNSANPNAGQAGQTGLSVALVGSFTHWTQGTTTAAFGAGVTVASLTVNSATSATAVLNIDPAATLEPAISPSPQAVK